MTKPTDTPRARHRARAKTLSSLAKVESATLAIPEGAFIQHPLQAILASAQRIVATELAYIEQAQRNGEPMTPAEAKKLSALVGSLVASATMEAKLNESEMGDLKDDELDRLLAAELEKRK